MIRGLILLFLIVISSGVAAQSKKQLRKKIAEAEKNIAFLEARIKEKNDRIKSLESESWRGPDTEPGKCYSRCRIASQFEVYDTLKILEYKGTLLESPYLETIQIEVRQSSTDWVKKTIGESCLPIPKDDCTAWCLQETPAQYRTVTIVKDTNQIKDYRELLVPLSKMIKKANLTQWREVTCTGCGHDRTLVGKIRDALRERGYITQPLDPKLKNKVDENFKAVLVQFQKDKGLPVGQLDYETLKALGLGK